MCWFRWAELRAGQTRGHAGPLLVGSRPYSILRACLNSVCIALKSGKTPGCQGGSGPLGHDFFPSTEGVAHTGRAAPQRHLEQEVCLFVYRVFISPCSLTVPPCSAVEEQKNKYANVIFQPKHFIAEA